MTLHEQFVTTKQKLAELHRQWCQTYAARADTSELDKKIYELNREVAWVYYHVRNNLALDAKDELFMTPDCVSVRYSYQATTMYKWSDVE